MTARWLCALTLAGLLPIPSDAAPQARPDPRVEQLLAGIQEELVVLRRDLHAHPELARKEVRTAGIVAGEFRKLGLEVRTGLAQTGVLGILRGARPGPVVAIRGDMDALPLTEETGLPFASTVKVGNTGVMHACGHDIHTTVLIGVARVLAGMKADLAGSVMFIAQPAEEGVGGARQMIEDGVFRDLQPAAVFALHVDGRTPTGTVKFVPGFSSANSDGFRLRVLSEGGHGASPHLTVDPILVGAQVTLALQLQVARGLGVGRDTVITVGTFQAGTASNIIPREARLGATVRTYGEEQRKLLQERVTQTVKGICEAAGARYELAYSFGYPSLFNQPELTQEALEAARRVLGEANALLETERGMGAEDFSYFAKAAPGLMFRLGVQKPGGPPTLTHSPTFLADEACIPVGVRTMSGIVLEYLAAHGNPKASGR
jgi:amidohydrolase